jgi:cytochrome c553
MAVIACAECHGKDLQGNAQFPSPALGIVRGYSREAFETLLRTGMAIGDREVGLMSDISRTRFARLTEQESTALYEYLSETGGLDLVASPRD